MARQPQGPGWGVQAVLAGGSCRWWGQCGRWHPALPTVPFPAQPKAPRGEDRVLEGPAPRSRPQGRRQPLLQEGRGVTGRLRRGGRRGPEEGK